MEVGRNKGAEGASGVGERIKDDGVGRRAESSIWRKGGGEEEGVWKSDIGKR